MQSRGYQLHTRKTSPLQKLGKQIVRHWQLYLFLLIPLIYLILIKYWPMLGAQIAFRNFKIKRGIWGSEWVGLKHFKDSFSSFYFNRVITNTLVLSFYRSYLASVLL